MSQVTINEEDVLTFVDGLIGMEERALALGGRLELRSAPGQGTSVRLECPVAQRAPASAA